jgi:transglutaminase-like putative cysteine protease
MKAFRYGLLSSSILAAVTVFLPLQPALAMESAITFTKATEDLVVLADGTYTEIFHREILARSKAAAHDAGQLPIAYDELTEDEPQVTEAYTLKADGTKLAVEPSAIYTQAASSGDTISSTKEKVIVFPKVEAGDVVAYTIKAHVKTPTFPGFFATDEVLDRTTSYNDWNGSISAPKSMPLSLEAHEMSVKKEEQGDSIRYSWHYSAPEAQAEDVSGVASMDRDPRLFISSFARYDDLGRAYAEMIAPALTVTPKVQAVADKITAGITDRRMQAEKIYDWVGQNIRYVSIQLGTGGYMPHAAEAVLENGYGDCKDHTVVLGALLRAKGIDSDIVAINLGNSYKVSEVPTLASFNHAINWLPEFNLYVDSTIGLAPFGMLTFDEYGKPVVHAVTSGGALRKTPTMAPGEASMVVKTTAKLDAEGKLTGETSTVATGAFGVELRLSAQGIEAKGDPDLGADGTGTYDFASPAGPGREYKILGRFDLTEPQYLTGTSFSMPALTPLPTVGDLLMGPLDKAKLKDSEPTACFTGTEIEEGSLDIPAGKRISKLPSDITIADDHLRFTTQWSVDGQVVSFRRELVSVIDQPLCSGEVRKSAAKALARIRAADRVEHLSLVDDGTGT